MTITITDRAFERIYELIELAQDKNLVLRVSVDSGGCSGLMYNYELVSKDNIEQDDYVFTKHNATIIIDAISQKFMLDCTLDFIEELGSSYFNVSNPHAKAKCGCGNSFSV
ncbi:iron-sulfur cluster assembly accessory protein [Rickettsia typhi]|uniref:Iron-binding protein IscA/HesB n=2 Tax=Rickettsia typhi TaxID=785 RepID=Q68XT7_RICTY|nr:iron-sulfur cluster assembly accessory protein [Rickettsia typhi]AAU03555.1 iron-binding protein IscA/HesB [Rickettsia typhi str. Wilmington]AFE53932.1 iron-binding protein IscA/HesB [Rickettsia typhi str. TH1527]AFE54770.1 iron-binding protein IscA/HesB [Rickettsia typhi str. B9991CWPP]